MPTEKFSGFDVELGTFGATPDGRPMDGWDVTALLLKALPDAVAQWNVKTWRPSSLWRGGPSRGSTDWGRVWMSNAVTCMYGDLGHLEIASATTRFPRQFAAQLLASLETAEAARRIVVAEAPAGTRINLTAHNAHHQDPAISWGQHHNTAIDEELWNLLFDDPRRPAVLGFVASAIAAGAVFFGSGHLLRFPDNRRRFVLSARSHHLVRLITRETTTAYGRGVLNSRREPLAEGVARLHTISFDASALAAALRCSFVQCVLAAAEHGVARLGLFDPVEAVRDFSYGFDVEAGRCIGAAKRVDGRRVTLPEYVRELATLLLEMVESGLIDERTAPDAAQLLPIVIELTHQLERGSLVEAARHLDWAAKLLVVLDASARLGADLDDPRVVLLDQDFHNTNPSVGSFPKLWDCDAVDPLVTRDDVARALARPPEESRDWARGALLERFADADDGGEILRIDWDHVELGRKGRSWTRRLRIDLEHLDTLNRTEFERILGDAATIDELEERLDRAATPAVATASAHWN